MTRTLRNLIICAVFPAAFWGAVTAAAITVDQPAPNPGVAVDQPAVRPHHPHTTTIR